SKIASSSVNSKPRTTGCFRSSRVRSKLVARMVPGVFRTCGNAENALVSVRVELLPLRRGFERRRSRFHAAVRSRPSARAPTKRRRDPDIELLPRSVGAVSVRWNRCEGEAGLELADRFLLHASTRLEVPE